MGPEQNLIKALEAGEEGRQLELDYTPEETSEFNMVMRALVDQMDKKIADRHRQAYFSFREIENFTHKIGKTTQEAGKLFIRFFNGLEEYGVKLIQPDYEYSRDNHQFPLALLTFVLSEKPENQDDAYDTLLRVFYSHQMGQLVVKQSTSA